MRISSAALLAATALVLIPSAQAAASLHVSFQHPAETVGPQKEVPVPIDIQNLQEQRVEVVFEILDGPGGRWHLVLPDAVILEPGETKTVTARVLTTFHDGYVKDHADWMVRATPMQPGTQEPAGEPADLEIGQGVKGWYVPGPSLPLALAALGVAGIVGRRST
jgi:hypothetical protein